MENKVLLKLENELNNVYSGELTDIIAYNKLASIYENIFNKEYKGDKKCNYISEYLELLLLFSSIEYNNRENLLSNNKEYSLNYEIGLILGCPYTLNKEDLVVDNDTLYFGKFFYLYTKVLEYCNSNGGALYIKTTEELYKNVRLLYNDLTIDKIVSEGVILNKVDGECLLGTSYKKIKLYKGYKGIEDINVLNIEDFVDTLGVQLKNGKLIFEFESDYLINEEILKEDMEDEDCIYEEDLEDFDYVEDYSVDYDDYGDLVVTSVPTYLMHKELYKFSNLMKGIDIRDKYSLNLEDLVKSYYVIELENLLLGMGGISKGIDVDEISDRVLTSYSYNNKVGIVFENKAVLCGEHIIGIVWEKNYNKKSHNENIFKNMSHLYVYKLSKEIIDDLDKMPSEDIKNGIQFDLLEICLDIEEFILDFGK